MVPVEQLEETQDKQLNMIRLFRNKVLEIQETLVAILKDLVTLIRNPLEEVVIDKINVSDLKRVLKLEVNIIEGKAQNLKHIQDIIMDLETETEAIEEIQDKWNSANLKTKKTKMAKKIAEAVNEALDLGEKIKIEIPSKVKEMINQTKNLIDSYPDGNVQLTVSEGL
ncbi:MAG: hypothetical protein NMK33_04170 [Candidatus Cardinium sp.]|uniref:hypothetical protein n=1 Tax=Cardinium endosymbiont of Dermatophagoides farinae TaxID=2597823 RepID=UPI0011838AAB|nr:hypothetical protein [Cardinium endosymbiont of Dermatophagoides farinae]TSJ80631.1 hypothetical protein FPG78_00895 [Cardinium endosymbiont of Dermatophagoides farinae]UWW96626.1 MAG: hypothetical protein NMK33_04170 [Candidatus Cardinium sp.]